jgi:2-hydroxychromene-2-carboxylate isomerase
MREVEFWYDVVCPYAYLASTQIERVAKDAGARVVYSPFLLGGVFRALGVPDDVNAAMPEAKRRHNARDMRRWAEWLDVPLSVPPEHPRSTVLALRSILACGEAHFASASHALFRAYWVHGLDVNDPEIVREVLDANDLHGPAVDRANDPEIKSELRTRTERAVERGVFGAPTFFVDGELFWGQDRLDFVARALAR